MKYELWLFFKSAQSKALRATFFFVRLCMCLAGGGVVVREILPHLYYWIYMVKMMQNVNFIFKKQSATLSKNGEMFRFTMLSQTQLFPLYYFSSHLVIKSTNTQILRIYMQTNTPWCNIILFFKSADLVLRPWKLVSFL
jgi:hypothetical protein